MFWKTDNPVIRSMSFRLTIWYAFIYAIASVMVYSVAYWTIKADLNRRVDTEIIEDVEEFEDLYKEGIEEVKEEIEDESDEIEREFFRFLTLDFEPVLTTDMRHWEGIDELTPSLMNGLGDEAVIREIKIPSRRFHARIACKKISDGNVLQIGYSFEDELPHQNSWVNVGSGSFPS